MYQQIDTRDNYGRPETIRDTVPGGMRPESSTFPIRRARARGRGRGLGVGRPSTFGRMYAPTANNDESDDSSSGSSSSD